ncbi:MAG: acyl-CoA dehydrogenase, partial [Pseudomonadota bacterium]
MPDDTYLDWPFFDASHRDYQASLKAWAASHLRDGGAPNVDERCRRLVSSLGEAGLLARSGNPDGQFDVRALC